MNTCARCKGLMVWEPIVAGNSKSFSRNMFKCVICGNRVDPVIILNREKTTNQKLLSSEEKPSSSQKRPRETDFMKHFTGRHARHPVVC